MKNSNQFHIQIIFMALGLSILCLPLGVLGAKGTSVSDRQQASAPYLIHPGDILQISVWKEQDLQREVLVLPDGTLSFPLVGQIQASGLTIEQVQHELEQALKQFIPQPVITVSATQLLGNKIYVLGQVNQPGEFLINRPVDVMQALTMAGGLTAFGAGNQIKVLRRNGDKQIIFPFKYKDVMEGEQLYQNILLKSGDVVIVP
jgi:polysaccharide biosynthesis/export protein